MTEKAEWKNRDFSKHPEPPEEDYLLFMELTLPDGGVVARIEQFTTNGRCFYATTPYERSGCLRSLDLAIQWCEHHSNNKRN